MEKVGTVVIWRRQVIALTDDSGKTVRSPLVPSVNVASPPRSCLRILREIARIDWVVNRLAAAISCLFAPPHIAIGSARRRSSAYPLPWPKSARASGFPSVPRTPRVTTSR